MKTMHFLIITDEDEPFYTNWFEAENNYREGCNMIVFNLWNHTYTIDGKRWYDIQEDHL